MTTSPGEVFDRYTIKARVYPALITVAPAVVLAAPFVGRSMVTVSWLIAGSLGGIFLLANLTRTYGKRLERQLVEDWNGLPTTRYLRLSGTTNPIIRERHRRRLESVTGETLPTLTEEERDPAGADSRYEAATRLLISRVRTKRELFPLIHEENISYGFRRNLLAVRVVALILLAGCLVGDIALVVVNGVGLEVFLAFFVHVGLLLAWLFVIDRSWVLEQGNSYAERLFEALDSDNLIDG